MGEGDLELIEDAWRRASDLDVAQALYNPEDYSEQVLKVVCAEAERRELGEKEIAELVVQRTFEPIRRLAAPAARFLWPRPLLWACVFGVAFQIASAGIPAPTSWISLSLRAAGTLVVPPLCLGWLCRPLRRYGVVLQVTSVCAVSWTVTQVIFGALGLLGVAQFSTLGMAVALAISLPIKWGIACAPLCGIVFLRNRYRPLYPPGHCTQCGYNLRGLPEPRCPECGTAFEPPT